MKENNQDNKKQIQTSNHFIGRYDEAPGFMKDNQHITHGYRIGFDTPRKIIRSLFMLHNESVNIWTHFLPALILICLIFYLVIFVGPASIIHDFQSGRQKLTQGVKQYSDALNNLTFFVNMKDQTDIQMKQLKQTLFNSYNNFQQGLQTWKKNAGKKFQNIQNQVKNSFNNQLLEMESLKQDFQKIFVPYVVHQIIDNIDPKYLQNVKNKLSNLKQKLDSSDFNYIQIPSMTGPNPHLVSRWPIFVFLFSAAVCLLCSTTFHLFYPMSGKAYQVFSRLDYAGINVLISGSSFPALYYGMYCNPELAAFYLTIICILGLSLFIVSLFSILHRPENFTLKSLAYGGFGVSLSIPLSHGVINELYFNNYGDQFSMSSSLIYYLLCGFCYLFGLYIYTARCPERHMPGKLNMCGHSHQIWHCFVVGGIIATYFGTIANFEDRKLNSCPIL